MLNNINSKYKNGINENCKSKKINLGIELLRTILSFFILSRHFLKIEYKTTFLAEFIFYVQPFYVPTFFLISFYFSYNTFQSRNINKIKFRFIRILIPYTIWPILLWLRFIIFVNKSIELNINIFKSIFFQLLIGYDFYAVLWFQFDLIMISIIFAIIIFTFTKNYLQFMGVFGIFLFIFNRKYERALFKYKRNDSIRRLNYSAIYSITGFILGSINIIKKSKNLKNKIFLLIIPVIILINQFKNFLEIAFRFQILYIDVIIIFLFILFANIPIESIKDKIIILILIHITKFTGGIYYIHYGVRTIFSNYFKILALGNLKSCVLNYLTCYLICFIGSHIFKNSILKFLFN